jgi:ArsR family transcriptional regulator, arsenate/arsenite/antimonite-responsive transcriptional repressor
MDRKVVARGLESSERGMGLKTDSKQLVEEDFQRIAKTIADPRRFEILQRVADSKELACTELRGNIPVTAATLSHHVKELVDAGLIEVRKESKCIHMKLRRDVWRKYLARLRKL